MRGCKTIAVQGCRALSIGIMLLVSCAGCSHGPRFLKDGHLAYNEAVRASADQELLLNIVRLRYLDTIEFLSTNSVSSQTAFSVGLGGRVGDEFGFKSGIGFGDVAWSDRPTFTFTPQRGQAFAKMMMSSIPVHTLVELAAADWDITAIMYLLVQNINSHNNVAGNLDPYFVKLVQFLGDLQGRTELYFGTTEQHVKLSDSIDASQVSGADLVTAAQAGYAFKYEDGGGRLVLTEVQEQPGLYIPHEASERVQLFKLLQMEDDGRDYIEIYTGRQPEEYAGQFAHIFIDTCSAMDAIAYLAGGVQPLKSHLDQDWVLREWPVTGASSQGLGDLFVVRSSEKRPAARLAVPYRGGWYYLADDDARSRMTFLILAEILRLAISPGEGQTPVLTLPVGR
jgi:hypothetical protein